MIGIIRIIGDDGIAIEHPTPAVSGWALRALVEQLRGEYAQRWGRAVYGYAVWR